MKKSYAEFHILNVGSIRNFPVSKAVIFRTGTSSFPGGPPVSHAAPNFTKDSQNICLQNSQNFSGLFPSSCIPKNMTFRKLDLFPSSREGGGEDTYSVGPLRERLTRCLLPHLHLRTETDPVSETSCFLEYRTMEKSRKIL
jgi:hypothetical protein